MLRKLIIVCLAIVVPIVGFPTAAQAAGWSCKPVTIKSKANGKYVRAELDFGGDLYGMLRAQSSSVGAREVFDICIKTDVLNVYEYSAIKSRANGLYITAEIGFGNWVGENYNGLLRARAATVGPWEKFNGYNGATWTSLSTSSVGMISIANNKHVTAEISYQNNVGLLRARATSSGPWEKFTITAVQAP